jgi:hypothetical protein
MASGSPSERRITWSPLGQNRFVVGGSSQLTLYDWSPGDSVLHVASRQDLQSMRVKSICAPARLLPLTYMSSLSALRGLRTQL